MAAHARLKNKFMEDKKYHNLMRWLISIELLLNLQAYTSSHSEGPVVMLFFGSFLWLPELPHDKTNKMTCGPSKDSDQPGHLPNVIGVFAVCSMGSKGPNASSCGHPSL